MHLRETLAAGGETISDTLHLVWAGMAVLFFILIMGFGAAASGKKFRIFSAVSFLVMMCFGILTSIDAPKVQHNLATPLIGIYERINVGVFLLWVIVFAVSLINPKPIEER